jgi:hypothetical protein
MNMAETVRRHATLSEKLMFSITCIIRALQIRLGKNDIWGGLYWEQLRKLWSRKAPAI